MSYHRSFAAAVVNRPALSRSTHALKLRSLIDRVRASFDALCSWEFFCRFAQRVYAPASESTKERGHSGPDNLETPTPVEVALGWWTRGQAACAV